VHDLGRLHPHHRDVGVARTGRTRTLALAVLCLCALVIGIDMTITNVALPFIGRDLDAPLNELQWVVDVYNIAIAGLLVFGGCFRRPLRAPQDLPRELHALRRRVPPRRR